MPRIRSKAELGSSGEETRAALLESALRLFGTKGYDATSTREIAAASGANIASIAYHFGSKDGLRVACAQMVTQRLMSVAGRGVIEADAKGDPALALELIEETASAVLRFLVGHEQARDIAVFIVREMARPGPVFDNVYQTAFEPIHRKFCALLGTATGQEPESDLIRLGAFSLLGQIVYFRIGYFIVARRMEWENVGPGEIESIRTIILGNIRAFVTANRKEQSS